jgi:hypothetical protein
MNEEKLKELESGLDRWHSCSPQLAKLLIAEVRRLRVALNDAWAKLDDAQDIIEKAQGKP